MTKYSPYWWHDQPQYQNNGDLPSRADIVVVGAGYTGLSAALTLAESGCSVIVLDAENIGFGASTRNGGMLGSGHKVSTSQASRRYGKEVAHKIHKEANSSLTFTKSLIVDNSIDCDLQECGRLRTAWTPEDHTAMTKNMNELKSIEHFDSHMVEQEIMHKLINTELYFGAQLYKEHASVHPRKLHYGILQLAINAGAQVFGGYRVDRVEKLSKSGNAGFNIHIKDKVIQCQQVLMATNGYTRPELSRYLSRRILPVPSFIATTEDIGVSEVESLLPGGNCIVETRNRYCYFRPTPCGRRIMLGTRAAMHPITAEQALPTLRKMLSAIFPTLSGVEISHCWTGFTGFSFSNLPNIGCHEGIYSAMGYCGNGVAMAPYLGHMSALKILNPEKQHSVFEQTTLDTRFYYYGKPWFMPISSAIYRVHDLIDNYRRDRGISNV
jgi:glycine/D-amino acid oxidase-like deaminating enzyme